VLQLRIDAEADVVATAEWLLPDDQRVKADTATDEGWSVRGFLWWDGSKERTLERLGLDGNGSR
jgi:hypothetical protein